MTDLPVLPECVSLTVAQGLAVVTLTRGQSRAGCKNPLSLDAMTGLRDVALWLKQDISTHCVILCGDPVFTSGADLTDPNLQITDLDPLEQRQILLVGPDMCAAWEALEQVTICAMEGFCIGGGLALAVACDWRAASEDCHIRLPEVSLGMNMSWQTNPRLTALIGPARTKQLVILGDPVPAETALAWGLVDWICRPGETLAEAKKIAEKVLAMPALPVRMSKQAITAHATQLNAAASFMDLDQFALLANAHAGKGKDKV
ncbi:MAG: enoyl-CoA hydratase/isomerase family protein [Parvibaculales bacterium]